MKLIQLSVVCAAALLANAAFATVPAAPLDRAISAMSSQQLLAREGNEGPRGEGKGHPIADETPAERAAA